MPVPNYQEIMAPLLRLASQSNEASLQQARSFIAKHFSLTDDDLALTIPSGTESLLRNRVGWARTFLKKAELLTYPRRGYFAITERGKQCLASGVMINTQFLKTFPEFNANWETSRKEDVPFNTPTISSHATPDELFERSYKDMQNASLAELQSNLQTCSPGFFEKLVVKTVVAMGYGGTLEDAGHAIGRSGDEGIDGLIKEDKLGLDVIYLQAKRWEAKIGRPEIQKFSGALQGQRAKKGVFITTSTFTNDALEYIKSIDTRIILISGERLARLMWEHNVGVRTISRRDVKEIDLDFFDET